jgi:hypothetical protein
MNGEIINKDLYYSRPFINQNNLDITIKVSIKIIN